MKLTLVIFVALLMGGVSGWLIRGRGEGGEGRELVNPENSDRREIFRRQNRGDAKMVSLEDFNPDELRSMSAEELQGYIEVLRAEAGIYGLSFQDQMNLEAAVVFWFNLDPDSALMWVNQLSVSKDRVKLLTKLSEVRLAEDLEKGIEFVRTHLKPEDGYVLPIEFLSKAIMVSEEKFLEVSRLSVTSDHLGSISSIHMMLPADFDFRKILDNKADWEKELGPGYEQRANISNLMSSWASRDPREAYEWLERNKHGVNSREFMEYLEGFSSIRSPAEVGEFLANHFNEEGGESSSYRTVRNGLHWKVRSGMEAGSGMLVAFYEQVGGDAVMHASRVLGQVESYEENAGQKFSAVLNSLPPDERQAALKTEMMQSRLSDDRIRQSVESSLLSLGHTPEEIATMLPKTE